jgi:stage V sporulation protein SpoVS
MSQYVETPCRPDVAAGAVAQFLRVKTPGAVAAAGATDVSIGTMDLPCLAAGPCSVRLRSAQGTRKMVASEPITAGNAVYAAASGKIAATGTVYEGIALETAAANNDVIEVMMAPNVDVPATVGVTTPVVTFNGLTGANEIRVPDNLADGLSIEGTHGDFIVFTTTDDGEKITVAEATQFNDHVTINGAVDLVFAGTTGQPEIVVPDNVADALSIKDGTGGADIIVLTTTNGSEAVAITPKLTCANGLTVAAVDVTPDDSESALNTIPAGAIHVDVQAVTNDANDFIVLPALANVPVGHEITILCNAGGNFELRTPADSDEEINSENCDGTKEYLCTDTEVLKVIKISDAIGWMAHAYSAIGAVVTAVVPDA